MAINKTEGLLWGLVVVMLVAVVAVLAYKGWPQLFPKEVIAVALNKDCDLHKTTCTTTLPSGGSVSLSIEPRPIPVIKPLRIAVTTKDIQVSSVMVDFSGVSMNMGLNRFGLDEESSGLFSGKGLLPICIRNRMDWEAKVFVETDQGVFSVPYRFETVANR